MNQFTAKHTEHITGTLSCFDRLLFKGYLPLGWPEAMDRFITTRGLRLKDFKPFAIAQSTRLKERAIAVAQKAGRPYIRLNSPVRKEDRAKAIAQRDGIAEGLVCVLSAVEGCQTFKLLYGKGRPRLVRKRSKCLCLYYYFIDREFGFMHIRIPTWFPFTVQVCLNGHDWLARKLDRHGLAYHRLDNAFLWIEDPKRAQRWADCLTDKNWPRILSAWARRVNPLMADLLRNMNYYWVTQQAEYATDVMFTDRATLKALYDKLLRHATLCFSAEDVMTFLGRKLHGNFSGEILNRYKQRWPGARVKHGMRGNWIKMYDKHGSILRIETVINDPTQFRVRRWAIHKGKRQMRWCEMAKGVANLYRYAEVCQSANRRYLSALAVVDDPMTANKSIHALARPVRQQGRTYRGFNPADQNDAKLFAAVMRGQHAIKGFGNRDVRQVLFKSAHDQTQARRCSARVSRLFKRLHVHGLIAKIPRARRWRVTHKGAAIMSMVITLHYHDYAQGLQQAA